MHSIHAYCISITFGACSCSSLSLRFSRNRIAYIGYKKSLTSLVQPKSSCRGFIKHTRRQTELLLIYWHTSSHTLKKTHAAEVPNRFLRVLSLLKVIMTSLADRLDLEKTSLKKILLLFSRL